MTPAPSSVDSTLWYRAGSTKCCISVSSPPSFDAGPCAEAIGGRTAAAAGASTGPAAGGSGSSAVAAAWGMAPVAAIWVASSTSVVASGGAADASTAAGAGAVGAAAAAAAAVDSSLPRSAVVAGRVTAPAVTSSLPGGSRVLVVVAETAKTFSFSAATVSSSGSWEAIGRIVTMAPAASWVPAAAAVAGAGSGTAGGASAVVGFTDVRRRSGSSASADGGCDRAAAGKVVAGEFTPAGLVADGRLSAAGRPDGPGVVVQTDDDASARECESATRDAPELGGTPSLL
eukprot:scaffold18699_cov175-Isochrysis_galbana.AAC.4